MDSENLGTSDSHGRPVLQFWGKRKENKEGGKEKRGIWREMQKRTRMRGKKSKEKGKEMERKRREEKGKKRR